MSLKELLDRFTLVSGLSMQEASRYLPIIEDCRLFFKERMKDELTESEARRAAQACAVYACYKISLIAQNEEVSSFKVGDVQIEPASWSGNAEALWKAERENICDLVRLEDGFAFRSVRI